MAIASPRARYSAIDGALASGFTTAELHHLSGRDRGEDAYVRFMRQEERLTEIWFQKRELWTQYENRRAYIDAIIEAQTAVLAASVIPVKKAS